MTEKPRCCVISWGPGYGGRIWEECGIMLLLLIRREMWMMSCIHYCWISFIVTCRWVFSSLRWRTEGFNLKKSPVPALHGWVADSTTDGHQSPRIWPNSCQQRTITILPESNKAILRKQVGTRQARKEYPSSVVFKTRQWIILRETLHVLVSKSLKEKRKLKDADIV